MSQNYVFFQAYGASKLASVLTAAGVGAAVGGPAGLAGAVAAWFVAELLTWALREFFHWLLPEHVAQSETRKLFASIWEFLRPHFEAVMDRLEVYGDLVGSQANDVIRRLNGRGLAVTL